MRRLLLLSVWLSAGVCQRPGNDALQVGYLQPNHPVNHRKIGQTELRDPDFPNETGEPRPKYYIQNSKSNSETESFVKRLIRNNASDYDFAKCGSVKLYGIFVGKLHRVRKFWTGTILHDPRRFVPIIRIISPRCEHPHRRSI